MTIVQRQILSIALFSFFLLLVFSIMFFLAFPLESWKLLFERKVGNLPFVYIVPSVILFLGALYGLYIGAGWKKQLLLVENSLIDLEQGRQISVQTHSMQEIDSICAKIDKVQKQMAEQTKLSQKLANEKAEDQEKRIQDIVSQERNRLARELHDSVSQQLFAASMMMSAITETRPLSDDRESKQLKMVEATINQSQLEMRALLLHLRPVALKGKSLQEGMKELLVELSQKVPMNITWKIETMPLDKGVEDHLFRILQESVSNTLRHAKSTTLEVLLIKRDEFVILRIVDDGIGFDVETRKSGSYGLQNMYERAVEIGGTLKIISLNNKGTRLEVKVPVI
ncbi:sensor histidine kinase [Metabacillus fastidiosus]|uniref:sensor histidine kinase n=1 Tax=Metabacillus fastidiosus TaxID=1458 RepID=UPI002DB60A3D|nr:sensor histidine kinase [Metabacillus fastidiosus]MEC2078196.1 sensor histidine kinase [Metabacillus fastidiosus]